MVFLDGCLRHHRQLFALTTAYQNSDILSRQQQTVMVVKYSPNRNGAGLGIYYIIHKIHMPGGFKDFAAGQFDTGHQGILLFIRRGVAKRRPDRRQVIFTDGIHHPDRVQLNNSRQRP